MAHKLFYLYIWVTSTHFGPNHVLNCLWDSIRGADFQWDSHRTSPDGCKTWSNSSSVSGTSTVLHWLSCSWIPAAWDICWLQMTAKHTHTWLPHHTQAHGVVLSRFSFRAQNANSYSAVMPDHILTLSKTRLHGLIFISLLYPLLSIPKGRKKV